jgi:hypothetical protein
LFRLHPEARSWFRFGLASWTGRHPFRAQDRAYLLTHAAEHLLYGDSRAAVVHSVKPLVVAAYSDEIDGVLLLSFPDATAEEHRLRPGARLLTVNTYGNRDEGLLPDLVAGPNSSGRWQNFAPYIAEFLSDDVGTIAARKSAISAEEWRRTSECAATAKFPPRDGRPFYCAMPARVSGSPNRAG